MEDKRTMTMYCSVDDVLHITRTTANKMGINEKENPDELDTIITRWIKYASALINDYTRSPLTEYDIEEETTKKLIYEDVCSRIVANRIALSEAYKNYAVITNDDWSLGKIPENIFGDDLKDALSSYKLDEVAETREIGITVVTGENLWK